MTEKTPKPKGRPKGTGIGYNKMMRVLISPRHEKLLTRLRIETSQSESEHVRRVLTLYLDGLIAKGDLTDLGPEEKTD